MQTKVHLLIGHIGHAETLVMVVVDDDHIVKPKQLKVKVVKGTVLHYIFLL